MPSLIAPACPVKPPPLTSALMSYLASVPVKTKGCFKSITSVAYGMYSFTSRPLTVMLPFPEVTYTLAIEDFLLPVP